MKDNQDKRAPNLIPEPLGKAQQITEESAQRLMRLIENSQPVRTLRASQLFSGILGGIGFALFVVGVENAAQDIPIISNAYGSIAVGVLFLAATGVLLKRLASGD
jgi:hypothetical protein